MGKMNLAKQKHLSKLRDNYLRNDSIWEKIEDPINDGEPEIISSSMYRDLQQGVDLEDYNNGGSTPFKPKSSDKVDFFNVVEEARKQEELLNEKGAKANIGGKKVVGYIVLLIAIMLILFLLFRLIL